MHGSSFLLAACVPSCLALALAGDDPSWTTSKRQLLPSCDLPKCQSVKDKAGCIQALLPLGGGSVGQLVACVSGGDISLVCSCAGCVTGLVDFLKDNSVCQT